MAHPINKDACDKLSEAVKDIPCWGSDYIFKKRWQIRRLVIRADMRGTDGLMGRFGGGWNWKLGFQAGGSTIIISLLVMNITFALEKKA